MLDKQGSFEASENDDSEGGIAEYKTKMEVQRKKGHMMAYRDLKKHYDKLVAHK